MMMDDIKNLNMKYYIEGPENTIKVNQLYQKQQKTCCIFDIFDMRK